MQRLDLFEGYPAHYDSIKVSVKLDGGSAIEAEAYVAKLDWVRSG